jgi:hypothetical protein
MMLSSEVVEARDRTFSGTFGTLIVFSRRHVMLYTLASFL